MPGIINNGPGLEIIYLIAKKKINNTSQASILKKKFDKSLQRKVIKVKIFIKMDKIS